ncbi:acyltransferase family protein [Pedobacter glucosidilyticus]|uniref:acyltransferase family protein n=1 Tax=Pedobacter glucosidilyticus TaxID=1122941 RepID=UPI00047A6087|nr:acyltransferase [Pedobacter glucosidilyticus]
MIKLLSSIPDQLRRVTSNGKFINEIDGLRFLAIIPVLIQHMAERFARNSPIPFTTDLKEDFSLFLAYRGFLGVYIFFVISGFILALPFAAHYLNNQKKIHLKDYYWRRLTRLEPPYLIWMTIFFIIFLIVKQKSFVEYLPNYLANITYTHTLIFNEWSIFNPPTWTLEIEIQFYILAPFIAWAFFYIKNLKLRWLVNTLALLSIILIQQYFKLYYNPYSFTILGHLQYFLLGFFIADIFLNFWQNGIKQTLNYDIITFIAFICLIFGWSWDYELYSRLLVMVSLFFIFLGAFKGKITNQFIKNRWVTAIGGMCYTIYLIHLPFAEFLIIFTKHIAFTNNFTINLLIQLAIFLPIILIISGICFLILEKPFMDKNWPEKFKLKFKK